MIAGHDNGEKSVVSCEAHPRGAFAKLICLTTTSSISVALQLVVNLVTVGDAH